MRVVVNGSPAEVPPRSSVAEALAALGHDPARRGLAVALDGEVVPRRSWTDTKLEDGARLEVLSAVQGG